MSADVDYKYYLDAYGHFLHGTHPAEFAKRRHPSGERQEVALAIAVFDAKHALAPRTQTGLSRAIEQMLKGALGRLDEEPRLDVSQ